MKHTNTHMLTRAKSAVALAAIACMVATMARGPIALLPTVHAASSFRPTVFVNTEAFLAIDDDDTTADVTLRFGDTLAKTLSYNRALERFEFNDDLFVNGTLSAANTLASSGSLAWEGAASGASLYVANSFTVDGQAIVGSLAGGNTLIIGSGEVSLNSTTHPVQIGDAQGNGNGTIFAADDANQKFTFMNGNVGIGTTDPQALFHVAGNGAEARLDTGTTNGNVSLSFVDNDTERAHLQLDQNTATFDIQSDGRITIGSDDYVNVSGGNYVNVQNLATFQSYGLGIGTTDPKTKLDVVGAISGSFIYATQSFSGAGLTDCDAGTSKLLWDATTGRFSCGTVTSTSYAAGQGLTLNGTSFKVNSTLTGSLARFTTLSGSLVKAGSTLASSGTLVVEGATTLHGTTTVSNSAPEFHLNLTGTSTGSRLVRDSSSFYLYNDVTSDGNPYAMHFDGTDDYLLIADNADQDVTSITLAAWVKTTSAVNYQAIVDRDEQPGGTRVFQWRINSAGKLEAVLFTGAGLQTDTAATAINDGNWHHVALSWNESTGVVTHYVDGAIDKQTTKTASPLVTGTHDLRIGIHPYSGGIYPFNGDMDDVRMYNNAVSDADVASIYNGGNGTTDDPSSGIVGWWKFDETSGDALDSSGKGHDAVLTSGAVRTTPKVLIDSETIAAQLLKSYNGATDNEKGILEVGDPDGGTRLQGQSLRFYTNGTERMRFTSGGLLGLGTTTPKATLQVNGILSGVTLYATRSFSGAGLTDCDAGTSKLLWDATTGRFSCGTVTSTSYTAGQGLTLNGTSFKLNATVTGSVIKATNYLSSSGTLVTESGAYIDGSTFVVQSGNNRVGIGTVNPGTRLNIESDGTDADRGLRIVTNNTSSTEYAEAQFATTDKEYRLGVGGGVTSMGAADDFYIYDYDNAAFRFNIDTNGNTGIGVTNPKAKLDVAGTISGSALVVHNDSTGNKELLSLKSTYGIGHTKAINWRDYTDITGQIDTRYDGSKVDLVFGHLYNGGYQTTDLMALTGQGNLGIGTTAPKAKLAVTGIMSGVTLYATKSFSGAGLTDCDAGTSKLLWDATTGRFSCGTDQTGGSGTGTLFIQEGAVKPQFGVQFFSGGLMNGYSGFNTFANMQVGGLGTDGYLRLSNAGNLTNIGTIQAGQTRLTRGGTFLPKSDLSTGSNPRGTVIRDVNGDGYQDLLVANYGASSVSVFIGSGNGSFATKVDYSTGSGDQKIAVGDLNGDGKPDIVSANYNANTASVLINKGDGTFKTKVDYATGSAPSGIEIADVNGDGINDVVTSNLSGNSVSILLGDGDGTLRSKADYSVYGSPYHVVVGDLNGDGKPDVATATYNVPDISVLLNYGDGTFAAYKRYTAGSNPEGLAMGDLNGDGKNDIVTANYGSSNVSVLLNTGTGAFASKVDYAAGTNTIAVAIGDLNGDGLNDIAATNYGAASMSVFINKGNGLFDSAVNYATGGNPFGIGIGDVNGDGKPEIAIANIGSTTVSVFVNETKTILYAGTGTGGAVGIGTPTPGSALSVSGSVVVGRNIGNATAKALLDVRGIMSGVTLYATRSFSGAGLTDCDNATTSKLLWDATTGRFICGTDQSGAGGLSLSDADARYVKKSGDTMTGTLAIQNGNTHTTTTTPLLNVRGTMSGVGLYVSGSGASALLSTTLGKPAVRIGGSGSLVLETRSGDPGSAPANTVGLFAQKVAGRPLLHQASGATMAATAMQTALFGNQIMIIKPGGGATLTSEGTQTLDDNTVSHPTADQTFGYMANFATAATSGDDAGTSSSNVAFFRGSTAGANGFFFMARVGVVDTGNVRAFVGMADQTISTMASSNNPSGNFVGFQFSTPRGDSNWQLTTKDNTTQNVVNTGVAFTANKVYDLYFSCTKQCSSITWEIRNVTDGTSATGTTSSNLPSSSAALRMVLGIESETTAAKNIRMQQLYVEADR